MTEEVEVVEVKNTGEESTLEVETPQYSEIEQQAIEVAGHNRKGLTWQINRLLACPIKSILALDAKTGEFHREPDFLGQGITVKAQLTNIAAECQCLSAEPVPLLVKRLIGCRSSGCHGNTFL